MQGAIIVSALLQVLVGFSGAMGFIIEYIGPLTVAPTVALVGLSLFETGYQFAGKTILEKYSFICTKRSPDSLVFFNYFSFSVC